MTHNSFGTGWIVTACLMMALLGSARTGDADAPRPLRIVCFGDSITGDRPGVSYQGQYLKFADLLGLMLEGRLGIGGAEVINSGWSGDTTYPRPDRDMPGAVGRLEQDVLAHRPDIVVVLIGGNDRKRTDEERQVTADNLATILTRLRQAGVRVLVLQYHDALPEDPQDPRAWRHLSANNDLIAAAARAANLPLLEMNGPMQRAADAHPRRELAHPIDGVHLNPRGEITFARAIFAKLLELGWLE